MFDFNYQDQEFVRVQDFTIDGDADKLAQAISELDELGVGDPGDGSDGFNPTFEGGEAGESFSITFEGKDGEGTVTWDCAVNLDSLDWPHPWEDQRIMDAEAVYYRHRGTAEARWTLKFMQADILRYLRRCVDTYRVLTPGDADEVVNYFFKYLHAAHEEPYLWDVDLDPLAELIAEAIEDAQPIDTSIPSLDAALGGGLHKGLSVLVGDPAAGKTTLAVQVALFAANKHGRVVYVMADMGGSKSALLRMLACAAHICGVEGCELGRASEWSPRERYEARAAFDRVSKGNVTFTGTKDASDLLEELKTPASLVVLDFAQAMTHEGKPLAFDVDAASCAVRELRAWAYENNAVVLLLSAYNKAASEAHRRGAQPSMGDILGSAELSYSAEHVLALTNAHDDKGTVCILDLKRRHGSGESCTLHLDAQHGLFS